MLINQEQLNRMLRAMIALVGGWLVSHGYQSADDAALWSGLVFAVAPMIWTYIANSDAAKIETAKTIPDNAKIAMVASMSDVSRIITSAEKADAIPSDKVVAE